MNSSLEYTHSVAQPKEKKKYIPALVAAIADHGNIAHAQTDSCFRRNDIDHSILCASVFFFAPIFQKAE